MQIVRNRHFERYVLLLFSACLFFVGLGHAVESTSTKPPDFAYCLWTRNDVEHVDTILEELKNTPCKTIFVCPCFKLERWDGAAIRPAAFNAVRPEETESLARKAKAAGYVVVLQPNLTINSKYQPEMLPNYNGWWQNFAHTSEATWEAWTKVLEEQAGIAERTGAEYLVCLHEADVLLIYPGWKDFIRSRLRKIAPSVKLVYSQHAMQHLRLRYEKLVRIGLWAFRIGRTCDDVDLAAMEVFEFVGKSALSPKFQGPKDKKRRRQLGHDLLNGWVKYRPPGTPSGRYPYLELVQQEFDAYKSSDYWPMAYEGRNQVEMVALYHEYPFISSIRILWWRPKYTVRFSDAQKATRELFGVNKPWFRETGLEALPAGVKYGAMVEPFVRATREAWTGFTDCIVWWGNGNDQDFIRAMKKMSIDEKITK